MARNRPPRGSAGRPAVHSSRSTGGGTALSADAVMTVNSVSSNQTGAGRDRRGGAASGPRATRRSTGPRAALGTVLVLTLTLAPIGVPLQRASSRPYTPLTVSIAKADVIAAVRVLGERPVPVSSRGPASGFRSRFCGRSRDRRRDRSSRWCLRLSSGISRTDSRRAVSMSRSSPDQRDGRVSARRRDLASVRRLVSSGSAQPCPSCRGGRTRPPALRRSSFRTTSRRSQTPRSVPVPRGRAGPLWSGYRNVSSRDIVLRYRDWPIASHTRWHLRVERAGAGAVEPLASSPRRREGDPGVLLPEPAPLRPTATGGRDVLSLPGPDQPRRARLGIPGTPRLPPLSDDDPGRVHDLGGRAILSPGNASCHTAIPRVGRRAAGRGTRRHDEGSGTASSVSSDRTSCRRRVGGPDLTPRMGLRLTRVPAPG